MAPHVTLSRSDDLPRLAWVLRYDGTRLEALVGKEVQVSDRSLFEGTFAMTPGPEAPRLEGIHLGSGASWADGALTLIAPSHRFEMIWVVETRQAIWRRTPSRSPSRRATSGASIRWRYAARLSPNSRVSARPSGRSFGPATRACCATSTRSCGSGRTACRSRRSSGRNSGSATSPLMWLTSSRLRARRSLRPARPNAPPWYPGVTTLRRQRCWPAISPR